MSSGPDNASACPRACILIPRLYDAPHLVHRFITGKVNFSNADSFCLHTKHHPCSEESYNVNRTTVFHWTVVAGVYLVESDHRSLPNSAVIGGLVGFSLTDRDKD